jgi:hypothetical protein
MRNLFESPIFGGPSLTGLNPEQAAELKAIADAMVVMAQRIESFREQHGDLDNLLGQAAGYSCLGAFELADLELRAKRKEERPSLALTSCFA